MISTKIICLSLATVMVIKPQSASACWIPPLSEPPSIDTGESQQAYDARVLAWQQRQTISKAYRAGETRGYRYGFEAGLWQTAPQILLVEIVKREEFGDKDSRLPVENVRIEARIVTIVRGQRPRSQTLIFDSAFPMWCETGGDTEVLLGKVGDKFVLFYRDRRMGKDSLIEAFGKRTAQDGRTTFQLGIPWKPSDVPEEF